MLHSPELMSSCLALSAAGYISRGVLEIDGVRMLGVLWHLQTSGLRLLRSALECETSTDILLATCLIWCLTDVFTYRQGISSWQTHLEGMRALLARGETNRSSSSPSNALQNAMKHLHQLYLSLQTLPHVQTLDSAKAVRQLTAQASATVRHNTAANVQIDGFLGYSDELLDVLKQIDHLSSTRPLTDGEPQPEADILLGRVKGMILRDVQITPSISIDAPLSPEYSREFVFCHRTFQQATLIQIYRRLFHLPSGSAPIQSAVQSIEDMIENMIQGQPCHTWVAMAMPLFAIGCEAFTQEHQVFALDKVDKLEHCIGSLHVKNIRQALRDVWQLREDLGDLNGKLCASALLNELRYSIILF
ncbi:C6 finger domain-containing protein [Moelleriella libera RCEF 2490]|uniref:C6 finger domain-containing protein n=1 Tax=Moelleriella libera RCEF 2490 TaxID=1081109 RepID=A0A168BHZ5_9HYPO|nr:C6 finger domain-containing protein [Moelleriella libera RCEF 2490]